MLSAVTTRESKETNSKHKGDEEEERVSDWLERLWLTTSPSPHPSRIDLPTLIPIT